MGKNAGGRGDKGSNARSHPVAQVETFRKRLGSREKREGRKEMRDLRERSLKRREGSAPLVADSLKTVGLVFAGLVACLGALYMVLLRAERYRQEAAAAAE